jgi:hypothetical protein
MLATPGFAHLPWRANPEQQQQQQQHGHAWQEQEGKSSDWQQQIERKY